jgi:hypothetical protein
MDWGGVAQLSQVLSLTLVEQTITHRQLPTAYHPNLILPPATHPLHPLAVSHPTLGTIKPSVAIRRHPLP